MENRITRLFKLKNKKIVSVYFTAGYPELTDTRRIIVELEKNGVDLIEIGIPFSDPVADGPVIQHSSEIALKNGMTLNQLFEQLKDIRQEVDIPLILMGYLNPVMQYGVEEFCKKCRETGIDGTILPDLPPEIYEAEYKHHFEDNSLSNILLITPQTSVERINKIAAATSGFIYMVSSSSTTGVKEAVNSEQLSYFERIQSMNLQVNRLVGFGISDRASFEKASCYADGAIIGSAFVQALAAEGGLEINIKKFVQQFT